FLEGPAKRLKSKLLHYSYTTLEDYFYRSEKYIDTSARVEYCNGRRSSKIAAYTHSAFLFFKYYFLKLGILDGKYGLMIAYYSARSTFRKHYRISAIQNGTVK
ncbi:MAG: hypothetical protein ABIA63_04095, partial [bacterium]